MVKKKTGDFSQAKKDNPTAMPGANDLVLRAEIIAIITERVRPPDDTLRQARDKVGKRIAYAVKSGRLTLLTQRRFIFGDVVRWARQITEWRAALAGLPETAVAVLKPEPRKIRNAHTAAYAVTSKDSEALLQEAYERINGLEGRLVAAQAEVDMLRPIAQRRVQIKKENQRNGRLGGRPRGERK